MIERREQGRHEGLRIPELARQAGEFVRYIETATSDSPASLEMLAEGESGDVGQLLEARLEKIDVLYARHDELFFGDSPSPDLEEVLTLSKDIIREARIQKSPLRTAVLGLGVLQFAEASAAVVRNPSLVLVEPDGDFISALARKGGGLVADAFHITYGERLKGNIRAWPTNNEHLGYLEDTHLAFWRMVLVSAEVEQRFPGLTDTLIERVQKLLPQFSAKSLMFDAHTAAGRPERTAIRQRYVSQIEAFREALESGESAGIPAVNNTRVALRFTMDALDTALRYGYSPSASLGVAAQNSATIGRLTERTTVGLPFSGTDLMRLEGSREHPELIIDFPEPKRELNFSASTLTTLEHRDRKGGHCPARYFVPLSRDGPTYENVKTLAFAIQERTGVRPHILHEEGEGAYIDLGALSVNYALLSVAVNYDA